MGTIQQSWWAAPLQVLCPLMSFRN
jgi:hypothetical protein